MNRHKSQLRTQEWLERLKENGYRLTAPRQAVVKVIASSEYVLNPLDVYEQARQRYLRLGLVTVYRTIEALEQVGLLQRVHQPSGCQGFISAFKGHQHLLICEQCGRVEIFSGDADRIEKIIGQVESQSGYAIHDHWLQLFGQCKKCQS